MNVETIYKTSEEKFVGEYVVYLGDVTGPGLQSTKYPYADPEHTIPIYAEQFLELMHNNVKMVTTMIDDGATTYVYGSNFMWGEQRMESVATGRIIMLQGTGEWIDPLSSVDPPKCQIVVMSKLIYDTMIGGTLPMALNEDDEPVSFFERGKRLLEAYAAYMEEQNDAE